MKFTIKKIDCREADNPKQKHTKIYIFCNWGNNKVKDWKESVLLIGDSVISRVSKRLKLKGTVKFDKLCGCQCGCSPGFRVFNSIPQDIFVDVKVTKGKEDPKKLKW